MSRNVAVSRRHVDALDGLRAVAVCAVIAFHLGGLRGGFVGVDVFFVLSGFLITAILHAEWTRTGRVDCAAFFAKRGLRLLPPLILCVAGTAAYGVVTGRGREIAGPAMAALTGTMNYASAHGLVGENPLGHTWSLAVEMEFYLVWPFVFVALCRRLSERAVLAVMVALAAAAATWRIILSVRDGEASIDLTYRVLETRADALLIGAVLAVLIHRGRRFTSRTLFALAALTLVAVAWRVGPGNLAFHALGFTAVALASAYVVGFLASAGPSTVGSALSRPVPAYVGRISYGLYLYHYPIIQALGPDATVRRALIALPATIAAAVLSYHCVERPILRLRAKRSRPALPAAA